jgi:hypothetical protein
MKKLKKADLVWKACVDLLMKCDIDEGICMTFTNGKRADITRRTHETCYLLSEGERATYRTEDFEGYASIIDAAFYHSVGSAHDNENVEMLDEVFIEYD